MRLHPDDTIAAIASPPGRSVRGIVRVSGPEAINVSRLLFKPILPAAKVPYRYEGSLSLTDWGVDVPASLMVWPTRRSFTGQPMVEFHLPGSPPVLNGLLEHLWKSKARPAERGEFTMRAFLNGRIDLLQAEAVLGVIDATSHDELKLALTQLGGGMTHRLQHLRNSLIGILGDLEAGLDFVEEDIEFISLEELLGRLTAIHIELQKVASQADSRLVADWQPKIVLGGLPNAGKSSLFNCLIGNETAIVSSTPGTTRDYLTAGIEIHGLQCTLIDTAGWEPAAHEIMGTAQEYREQQLLGADLVLWCESLSAAPDEKSISDQLLSELRASQPNLIHVVTQIDRYIGPIDRMAEVFPLPADAILLSAHSGAGVELLRDAIAGWLKSATSSRGELLSATSARCKDSLRRADESVQSAITAAHHKLGDELISLDLRNALQELGTVMGTVYTDDILDHIFSNFCIGK